MKTVLITGVSRGIGKALAKKFIENDYSVIGTSTRGASSLIHPKFKVLPLELTNSESIEGCVSEILKLGVKIDILINNAGTWVPTDKGPNIDIPSLRKTLSEAAEYIYKLAVSKPESGQFWFKGEKFPW